MYIYIIYLVGSRDQVHGAQSKESESAGRVVDGGRDVVGDAHARVGGDEGGGDSGLCKA